MTTIPNAELLRIALSHCLARAGLDRPGHRYRSWVELTANNQELQLRHVGAHAHSALTLPADGGFHGTTTIELLLLHKALTASKREPVTLDITEKAVMVRYGSVTATCPTVAGVIPSLPVSDDANAIVYTIPRADLLSTVSAWALSDRSTPPVLHLCHHLGYESAWAIHRTGILRCRAASTISDDRPSHIVVPASGWSGWRTPTTYRRNESHVCISTKVAVHADKNDTTTPSISIQMWLPHIGAPFPAIKPLLDASALAWHGSRDETLHAVRAVMALTDKTLNAVIITTDGQGAATVKTPPSRRGQQAEATCTLYGPIGTTTLNAHQLVTVLGCVSDADVLWSLLPHGPVRLASPDQDVLAILSPVSL